MFEYYGNIHVYCPRVGADEPLESNFFQNHSLREIVFQLQDSCLADCKILLDKTQFCRTVLYVIIKNVVIFARHLSDKIKYFVSQNEILLVLTDRPALFVKTEIINIQSYCPFPARLSL